MQNVNEKSDAGQKVNAAEESMPMLTEPNGTDDAENDTENDNSAVDQLAGLPVDRGWSWMILVGAVWQVILYGGVLKSYGVFFVQFQKRFGSSASETALIQTMFNSIFSVSGIFVMTVGLQHVSARTLICIGTLLSSVAYAVSAFAWRIEIPIFFLGAMAGLGASMIWLPAISLVGIYFHKYRGMANSTAMAGASLGALMFGPLYSTLFEYYGYTGTMLITSGMLLNVMITGCLLRPPEFYTKSSGVSKKQSSKTTQPLRHSEQELEVMTRDKVHTSNELSGSDVVLDKTAVIPSRHKHKVEISNGMTTSRGDVPLLLRTIPGPSGGQVLKDTDHTENDIVHEVKGIRLRSVSECRNPNNDFPALKRTNLSVYSDVDSLTGSLVSLNTRFSKVNNATIEDHNKGTNKQTTTTCCDAFQSKVVIFLRTTFDPSVLKDPVFIHLIFFCFVSFGPSACAPVFLVPFANDIGISSENIKILLVLIGCLDLISRISVGIIVDRKWLKPTTIVAVASIIMGVVHNFTRLIHSFPAMLAFVLIQSLLAGIYFALFAVILVENLGIEKFKSALGFTGMAHGASGAAFFPLMGVLRDTTGAYYWPYSMLSVLVLMGAILAMTLPITHRRCHKKKSTDLTKEEIVK